MFWDEALLSKTNWFIRMSLLKTFAQRHKCCPDGHAAGDFDAYYCFERLEFA
jgi:hypothetical protein